MSTKQERLRDFYQRRHPEYSSQAAHWAFLRATYQGGRDWFSQNIFKFFKEGDKEFAQRVDRAYRFNHTREAVDLVVKYLFKAPVLRNVDDASQPVKDFWKNTTLDRLDIDQFMRTGATGNAITGRVALVVDNNKRDEAITVAESKRNNVRIYAYLVNAEDVLDYAYDEDGDGGLLWVKLRELTRDDQDPINSSGEIVARVRLWTRTEWVLYEEVETKSRGQSMMTIKEIDRGEHDLGFVPVRLFDHTIGSEPYRAPGLIDEIAYLDRAVANYLSNLDAIIQDQTFSQLAIPAQGLMPGEEIYNKVLELGTKRIFVFDAGGGSDAVPKYIAPDPKQAGVILSVIEKIINEIYHTIGLAGERTKQDNAVGIDNSSGVAKAYDFERVNSLLRAKAQSCQNAENWLVRTVCAWAGEEEPKEDLVSYPETFDVMRLADELSVAEQLAKVDAPADVRREQMRLVVEKLFPRLKDDLRTKIAKDIDGWLKGENLTLDPPSRFSGKSATQPSRQGQVTDKSEKSAA